MRLTRVLCMGQSSKWWIEVLLAEPISSERFADCAGSSRRQLVASVPLEAFGVSPWLLLGRLPWDAGLFSN